MRNIFLSAVILGYAGAACAHDDGKHAGREAHPFSAEEHDEPFMVHVAPGKGKTIVWQFTREGTFHFGCPVPGHMEAGMTGRVEVVR